MSGGRGMEYKEFDIRAFEQEPRKWRARVRRTNGMPLIRGERVVEYLTEMDATTAAEALKMAMAAIDAAYFLPRSKRGTERFWRRVMANEAKTSSRR
jgi:hypothetical protein